MKILKNKTYKELLDYKSKYLELLWKPFQGVFEKVTDDELLRDNANLHAALKEAKEARDKAIDILITWGESLNPEFQKLMLEALRYKE